MAYTGEDGDLRLPADVETKVLNYIHTMSAGNSFLIPPPQSPPQPYRGVAHRRRGSKATVNTAMTGRTKRSELMRVQINDLDEADDESDYDSEEEEEDQITARDTDVFSPY